MLNLKEEAERLIKIKEEGISSSFWTHASVGRLMLAFAKVVLGEVCCPDRLEVMAPRLQFDGLPEWAAELRSLAARQRDILEQVK